MFLSPQDVLTIVGKAGPGKGKHIVLLAGDEEYRSEEAFPQLAKILAERHGFTCTVVFSLNARGEIDPNVQTHQPGIEALDRADLCVMQLRFRQWPDAQMKHFVDYYRSGKPILALRTSTHAFSYPPESTSAYRAYGFQSKDWPGGFGKQALGENWVSHWGNHGSQATLGVVEPSQRLHPVLRGVTEVFGPTDVYEVSLPADATILMRGQVLTGMERTSSAATDRKKTVQGIEQPVNEPAMPIVWYRRPTNPAGKQNEILVTTMGAATDLLDPGFRRLLVNGTYWLLGLDVPKSASVDFVGRYDASPFGFDGFKKGVKPRDLL